MADRRYAIYTRQSAEPRDGLSSCEAQFQTCFRCAEAERGGGNLWIGERSTMRESLAEHSIGQR